MAMPRPQSAPTRRPEMLRCPRPPPPPSATPSLPFAVNGGGGRKTPRVPSALHQAEFSSRSRTPLVAFNPSARTTRLTTAKLADASKKFPAYVLPDIEAENIELQKNFFEETSRIIRDECSCFASFAVFSETLLAKVRVAAEKQPAPNSLQASVAALLLSSLSSMIGPAHGKLLRRLLNVVFRCTFCDYRDMVEDDEEAAPSSSSESVAHFGDLTIFPQENAKLLGEIQEQQLRLNRMAEALERQGKLIEGLLDKSALRVKRYFFRAWKWHLRTTREARKKWARALHNLSIRNCNEIVFTRWVSFVRWSKARGGAELSAQNRTRLEAHLAEAHQRCGHREEHIRRLREEQEKLQLKQSRLEEVFAAEQVEGARTKTLLYEAERREFNLARLASDVLQRLEARENYYLASTPSEELELAEGFHRAKEFGDVVPMGFFHPQPGGCADQNLCIPNVAAAAVGWLNCVVASCDPASEVAATEAPSAVSNVSTDLSDGKLLVLILHRIAQISSPGQTFASNSARCEYAIKLARHLGLDGGVTAENVVGASPENEIAALGLVSRVLNAYAHSVKKKRKEVQHVPAPSEAAEQLSTRFVRFSERAETAARWKHIGAVLVNFSNRCLAQVVKGEPDEFPGGLKSRFTQLPLQSIAELMPSSIVPVEGDSTSAAVAVCDGMRNVLLEHFNALREVQFFYSACSTVELVMPLGLDAVAWARFISDAKLVPKMVSRSTSESVFRNCCTVPGADGAAVDAFNFCIAIVKLFLAHAQQSAVDFKSISHCVSAFSSFLEGSILPFACRFRADNFVAACNDSRVQETLRLQRDALRKVFGEVASREQRGSELRIRLADFVRMATKELRQMDAADAQLMYNAVRNATVSSVEGGLLLGGDAGISLGATTSSSLAATYRSAATGSAQAKAVGLGIAFPSFGACVVALSRHKYGNFFLPLHVAVQQYITGTLLPNFSMHRAK